LLSKPYEIFIAASLLAAHYNGPHVVPVCCRYSDSNSYNVIIEYSTAELPTSYGIGSQPGVNY